MSHDKLHESPLQFSPKSEREKKEKGHLAARAVNLGVTYRFPSPTLTRLFRCPILLWVQPQWDRTTKQQVDMCQNEAPSILCI